MNYFEISSTVIDTPKYKISHPCVSLYFNDVIILSTVFEMLCSVF